MGRTSVKGPIKRLAQQQASLHHGGVLTSAGDFSVQDDAEREQQVPLVQLQVRDDLRQDLPLRRVGSNPLSAADTC